MKSLQMTIALLFLLSPLALIAAEPVVEFRGSDFRGGGAQRHGATAFGRAQVNYVYAQSTGRESSMTATFQLATIPREKMILTLEARDDDSQATCRASLRINDTVLFSGADVFPKRWLRKRFEIPANALKVGENTITISNLEPTGPSGNPPWFMVARCTIAGEAYQMPSVRMPEYRVTLPDQIREFPEPLPAGQSPGFAIRGTKGWAWTPEQYLAEIPILAKGRMNFLMNCYLSLFIDQEGRYSGRESFQSVFFAPGGRQENAWWLPLPDAVKEDYIKIFKKAKEHDIYFCFAVHPQFASSRPLDPNSEKDIDNYYQHFDWAQKQGIQWFSITLDDVSWGIHGPAIGGQEHSKLVNAVFERLRKNDPEAQMIFCPVPYWGDGTNPDDRAYLEAIAENMHEDVFIFWTGKEVVPQYMRTEDARSYRNVVQRRLIIWENYPVNDATAAIHLGPIIGRDVDLNTVCYGYVSNPMYLHNEANRIPLLTCADYAWNPHAYDPDRSIGQAIMHLAETQSQREVLKALVETYPGTLIARDTRTGFNTALARFDALLEDEDPNAAKNFIDFVADLANRLEKEFPGRYPETLRTLRTDVRQMQNRLR